MKKALLFSLVMLMAIAVSAQRPQLKPGIPSVKAATAQKAAIEPVRAHSVTPAPQQSSTKNPDIVNILTLGTAANAYTYGYAGGQKTMVWADDDLDAVINLHRMGPGSTPPSFSGYLGLDIGINGASSISDWTLNWQIYAATLNTGGTYFLDAARYPQGGLYKPAGATSLSDCYFAYFAPNLSTNSNPTWGGYSYGRIDMGNQADSSKHLRWYTPPPFTYIPDGFTITGQGVVLETDLEQEWAGASFVGYKDNIVLGRGVWNAGTMDFDYEFTQVSCPTTDAQRPANERIAASPDGNTVWIVVISNNGGAIQTGDSGNYYPILIKSVDGGATWGDPMAVQLDGPDGIDFIVNEFLSDYRIQELYGQMVSREEIPYTTAFDCDLVVDKWGNPHIGVVVGVSAGDYSIAIGDSAYAVFDIYSTDDGATWNAVRMGQPLTFRGTFATDYTEDNRVNIASNQKGDFVFVTYNDTQIPGQTDNINPDVFARGFNLLTNMITDADGLDAATNVTFLSDVTQDAPFECTSHYVLTKENGGHTIPIVTVELTGGDPAAAIAFKYISDFSFDPGDYTIPVGNPPFPVGVEKTEAALFNAFVSPNPVKDLATLKVNLKESGNLSLKVVNALGQNVMNLNKGFVEAGIHQYTLDASSLKAGVYFCTVILDGQKFTTRMIVE